MATWKLLGFILLLLQTVQGRVVVEVYPREAIVLPRQNVTFLCKVSVPLQYCRVEIQGQGAINLNNKLPPKGGVSYYGAGLAAGQCGFTMDHVDDANNGKVKCFLGIETEYDEPQGSMQLTVARPPKSPELDLSRGTDSVTVYKVNDLLHASCIVRDGRPVANISWYLDDEPLYGDGLSMPTIIDFAKVDLHSKVQNLTRILQPSDNGKLLKCIASHPALFENNIAARQLDVKYSPLPLANPIDKFGYELGKPGLISVEIDANPKPQLEWTVRGQRIKEGHVDSSGRIEAEVAQDRGRGHYVANLRLAAINKQDTETQFILTAYNDMGTQEYTVLISTSPEPEGVEFGATVIVALVATLLIITFLVFLTVFAWKTDRWCFSETGRLRFLSRVRQQQRSESSDTESAEPKIKEHFLTPLRTKLSALKRSRDKVSSMEEAGEQSALKEEAKAEGAGTTGSATSGKDNKEGIVYAELDLVGPKVVMKTKEDDKTEYAEIVYKPTSEESNESAPPPNADRQI